MKISKKAEYAIKALMIMGRQEEIQKLTLRHISVKSGISYKFLEQIMLELRHSGFVRSVRGREGGYMLNRSPREIMLGDVLRAVDGGAYLPLMQAEEDSLEQHQFHGFYDTLSQAGKAYSEIMDQTSVWNLVRRSQEHIQKIAGYSMYHI